MNASPLSALPASIARLLDGFPLSENREGLSEASVYFSPARGGMYLKLGAPGSLRNAALMQEFFHKNSLSAPLVAYESGENDYLLVGRVPGRSSISPETLSQPVRLARVFGESARRLHETPAAACPIKDLPHRWRQGVEAAARGTPRLVPHIAEAVGVYTAENALREIEAYSGPIDRDTLVHGDLCLPNFMMDDLRFTGFIDLGEAGLGDRNCDLFWALWSLGHNLGDRRLAGEFLDAYGRDAVDEERIRLFGLMNSVENG